MTGIPAITEPLIVPQLRFEQSDRRELYPSLQYTKFDPAHLLFEMRSSSHAQQYKLSEAGASIPDGSYNVAVLVGGAHRYFRSPSRSDKYAPWWDRLDQDDSDSFTVWGRPFGARQHFDPSKPVRWRSGRGVVYTRWPVFDPAGELVRYGWRIAQVEFEFKDRKIWKDSVFCLTLKHHHGTADLGDDSSHELPSWGIDAHWQELMKRAKAGFDAQCTARPSDDTLNWREWFLDQRDQAEADRLRFQDGFAATSVHGKGWLAALDSVEEAWQLPIALAGYRGMFPQEPPDPNQVLTAELLMDPRFLLYPIYEGTLGSMEDRLLQAYFRLRPERDEPLIHWMADYASLISSIRNYTGD